MGYTTEFEGVFSVTPTLTPDHQEYLRAFSYTRRMQRDVAKLEDMPDDRRKSVGLPLGVEGEYYVGSADDDNYGQSRWAPPPGEYEDISILDFNEEPSTQPSLWCKWRPTEDGTWD